MGPRAGVCSAHLPRNGVMSTHGLDRRPEEGIAIELDGELWQVLDYHHIKMGRGSAQVKIKLRNIKRGQTVERSFQAGDKWPRANMEKRPVQFLYRDGDDYHFMELENYEQFVLSAEQLGDAVNYLKDGISRRPHQLPGRDHRHRAAHHHGPAVVSHGARLRRRHRHRGPQGRHAGDRASSSRCRCSWTRATSSASTPAPASTRPASERTGHAGCVTRTVPERDDPAPGCRSRSSSRLARLPAEPRRRDRRQARGETAQPGRDADGRDRCARPDRGPARSGELTRARSAT